MYKNDKDRILNNVEIDPISHCWNYKKKVWKDGYARTNVHGTSVLLHRFSYTLFKGEIPQGMCVLHACDNPRCLNPDHLSVGTHKENTQDMMKRGRHRGNHKYPTIIFEAEFPLT